MPAFAGIRVYPRSPLHMMDNLWSPWRSHYVSTPNERTSEGCFLCRATISTVDPEAARGALVVAAFEHTIVLLNRYPYNAGHLLIAPRQHVGDLTTLPSEVTHELMDATQLGLRVLESELHPHGVNVGANLGASAGAGVPDHLHIHLVPRWNGDTNFMPVIGETKVVSEFIDVMCDRFILAFNALRPS